MIRPLARSTLLASVALASVVLASCSYTTMARPPSGQPAEHASDCDDELGMPLGDVVFAGAFAFAFVGYAGGSFAEVRAAL